MFVGFVSKEGGEGGFGVIGIAMYLYLGDCSWEVHMRKKEVAIERRYKDTINLLQLYVEKRQFFNQNNRSLNNIY